jgi:hypothetical protein
MELELPSQIVSPITFVNTLVSFFVSLIIIDVDPELTQDNTLASPFELKNYNVNIPIRQF